MASAARSDTPDGLLFRILGPVEVTTPGGTARIPPGRQQIILGALVLEANRVVGMDQLIDAVWEERPPSTARSQVQICVSALRQALGRFGLDGSLLTRSPGYLLQVPDDQVDVRVFRGLVERAKVEARSGRPEEAARLLRRGLALWRGPALGGEVAAALRSRAVRLDEEHLSALEDCVDLELELGQHHRLVAELGALVAEHPLRERLRGQFMLALYRARRPAEALDAYRTGRRVGIEELGIEPGEELRKLEVAILSEDRALRLDAADEAEAVEPAPRVGPHQLPADIADFTGRAELVEQIGGLLGGGPDHAVPVVVLAGKAGVGKTTLAVRVGHRMRRERFPDGQLYCSLGGMRLDPIDPVEVLGRFLRALGVSGPAIPEGADERADMYRSLLADKRVLIVLDDAATESQVLPLLPGSESCAVVVTSRTRLAGIPGARLFDVDVLDPDSALELLGRVIGAQRVAREPAAAQALVRLVGGLSLALRIVAARLVARPHWSLASMVGRLADERRRLDELAHGDMIVRASLALTYDGLDAVSGKLFRLLGLTAAESLPTWVAGALLDDEAAPASGVLEQLVDTQMLDVVALDLEAQPRYTMHAIIHLFAKERLAREESAEVRTAALGRVLGGWLALTEQAHRRFYGGDFTVLRGEAPRWSPADGFGPDLLSDPLGWLDSERLNLCAAVEQAAEAGMDELSWELAVRLVTLFEANSYFDEWQRTHESALAAVRAAGNRRGEAAVLCSLGSLHLSKNRYGPARAVLRPALETFTELGDPHGLAMAWRNLALLDYSEGDSAQAAEGYRRAAEGFARVGDAVGQAHVLGQMARIELDAADYDTAIAHLNRALALSREAGGLRVEAQVLFRLGSAMLLQRRHDQAESIMLTVLEMVRRNRDAIGEGHALHALGQVRARLGRHDEAEALLRSAVAVRQRILDHVGVARGNLELAVLLAGRNRLAEAIDLADGALRTFTERGLTSLRGRARAVLDSLVHGAPVPPTT